MNNVKFKLKLKASSAKPIPPIAPILSGKRVNVGLFCKKYNDLTSPFIGLEIPVTIIIKSVTNFFIILNAPSLSSLITLFKDRKGIKLGSLRKILAIKSKDLYPILIKNYLKSIRGTLKSMKVNVYI